MISKFKRKTIALLVVLGIVFSFMAGCSSSIKSTDMNTNNSGKKSSSTNNVPENTSSESQKSSSNNLTATSEAKSNSGNTSLNTSQEVLLTDMMKLAKQGKVINSEFPVKTTVIDSVEKKLGKPDKVDWIPAAKGNYASFSRYNLAFGFNKGSQIFEARSFDSRLKELTLSSVEKVYGTPAYDINSNGEEIIGYVAGQDYKILLVFSKPDKGNKDPQLDHYSVLYPKGTVNMMADDPGREW